MCPFPGRLHWSRYTRFLWSGIEPPKRRIMPGTMTIAYDCASNRETECQHFWQTIVGACLESMAGLSITLASYIFFFFFFSLSCRISELLTFVSEWHTSVRDCLESMALLSISLFFPCRAQIEPLSWNRARSWQNIFGDVVLGQ